MNQKELRVKCEVFTRVCGYYRPVNQFNPAKKQECSDRILLSFNNSFAESCEVK